MEVLLAKGPKKGLKDYASCKKTYGTNADRVWSRLLDLQHLTTLEDVRTMPGFRCHELTGDYTGCLAISINKNWRMIFAPNGNPPPQKDDGGLDWTKVESITIVDIVDYH